MKIILSLIAGAIGPFAFSPFDYYWLIFPSLGLLFYFIINSQKPSEAFWLGYAYGFAYFGIGVNWLHISINLFGGVNLVGAYLATYALVAFISLYPALTGYLCKRFYQINNHSLYILIIPSLWTLTEWCRSWIFTGFPWLNIGYSQTDSIFSSLAPILGVYGLGFFIAIIAVAMALLFSSSLKEKVLPFIIIITVSLLSYILQSIEWTQPKEKTLKTALIQGGIPQEIKWQPEQRQKTIDLYVSLSEPYWKNDLIIWPETAMPFFFDQAKPLVDSLREKAIETNTDLIIGFPYRGEKNSNYYNSLIVLGKEQDIYYKRHLVPFGEYLPFDSVLRPILYFLKIPMSAFSKGTQAQPILKTSKGTIGVSICYEDVFGEEVIQALPGAGVLVNVSNDAWFGDSLAPPQHLQMARMRAIETGRYMLRATNNGISAIIDEKGNILKQSVQFKADTLSSEIRPFKGETPYVRVGNYGIIVPLLILLLFFYRQTQTHNTNSA